MNIGDNVLRRLHKTLKEGSLKPVGLKLDLEDRQCRGFGNVDRELVCSGGNGRKGSVPLSQICKWNRSCYNRLRPNINRMIRLILQPTAPTPTVTSLGELLYFTYFLR